ncbi:triple QxxK/R motif-containing protein isoform X2 [Cyanistes caeruleus]|uniref:triple QxxK/R motif-containing protein isoform X2 n=1 Tax=Cyanistes caeruleus TaxID=156563 RepID=UPI000CDAC4A3|nr:triple QxxK/R motif-containing protein isoform X2 [Cyanistes caeruleus]
MQRCWVCSADRGCAVNLTQPGVLSWLCLPYRRDVFRISRAHGWKIGECGVAVVSAPLFSQGGWRAVSAVIFGLKTMGRKDASTSRTPVDQYRKQIGKQDYKKTRPMLRATRLKAEAKKTALGVKKKEKFHPILKEFVVPYCTACQEVGR